MKQKFEKNIDSKIKTNKLIIVCICIIFIVSAIVAITLIHLSSKHTNETVSDANNYKENFTQEADLTTIPDDAGKKNENTIIEEITENTNQNIVQNSTNKIPDSSNVSSPTNSTNANTNTDTNTNKNFNTNSNSNSNSDKNTNSSTTNTNSSSESNASKNDNSTDKTASETAVPSPSVTKPYIVETKTSKDLTNTETKYGVIISTYTTSTYDIYSDGSKKLKSSYDSVEYDKTSFNATTSELLPEARMGRNQYSSMINQVLKNVNLYRQEANEDSKNEITNRINLTLNDDLCVAATARAIEIAYSSTFSHTRPNGSTCFTILDEMNIFYNTAGENIASGYSNADSVSNGWKDSPGHYRNMIDTNFSQIGIGVFELENTYYWVQLFN